MKTKLPLAEARTKAENLQTVLAPFCERVLIAGSIRRQKAEIGDIELVLIPQMAPMLDMFGQETGTRESLLDYALEGMQVIIIKGGDKYKQIVWQGMQADLFICTPETWGCVATIRTGSADFTRWLVTKRRQGGACPEHLNFKDGRLWDGKLAIDTNEEQQVFATLGLHWVEPTARIEGRWRR